MDQKSCSWLTTLMSKVPIPLKRSALCILSRNILTLKMLGLNITIVNLSTKPPQVLSFPTRLKCSMGSQIVLRLTTKNARGCCFVFKVFVVKLLMLCVFCYLFFENLEFLLDNCNFILLYIQV